MKLHNVIKNEDGTVTVETELTPEETRALLHLGIAACVQNGIMVASLAHYFNANGEEVENEFAGAGVGVYDETIEELMGEIDNLDGIGEDVINEEGAKKND